MTSTEIILGQISSLNDRLNGVSGQLQEAEKILSNIRDMQVEGQRQVNYHLSRGDVDNANNASATILAPANAQYDAQKKKIDDLQMQYNSILNQLNSEKAKLTPAEQATIVENEKQQTAEAEKSASKARTESLNTEKETNRLFAEQQSKVITYIGIVFVAIVLITIGYFAFFKNTRPEAE